LGSIYVLNARTTSWWWTTERCCWPPKRSNCTNTAPNSGRIAAAGTWPDTVTAGTWPGIAVADTWPDIAVADTWPDIALAGMRSDIAAVGMRSDIAAVGIVVQTVRRARYNTEAGTRVPMDSRKWYCHTVVPHKSVNN